MDTRGRGLHRVFVVLNFAGEKNDKNLRKSEKNILFLFSGRIIGPTDTSLEILTADSSVKVQSVTSCCEVALITLRSLL